MSRRVWGLWVVVMSTVFLGSCASKKDPADMSSPEACEWYAEKVCEADARCIAGSFPAFWNDMARCRERLTLGCASRLTAAGTNDTAERVGSCANALEALSCDDYVNETRWPASCNPPPGNVVDGAACIVPGQCQGGGCTISSRAACGVCRTVGPAGSACTSQNDCLNYLPCSEGVCTDYPSRGEKCTFDLPCSYGLICRGADATTPGTCEPRTPAGGTCVFDPTNSPDDGCAEGFTCDSVTKKCLSSKQPLIGEPCPDGICGLFAFCDGNICRENPREGQACAATSCLSPAKCIDGICKIRDAAVCK